MIISALHSSGISKCPMCTVVHDLTFFRIHLTYTFASGMLSLLDYFYVRLSSASSIPSPGLVPKVDFCCCCFIGDFYISPRHAGNVPYPISPSVYCKYGSAPHKLITCFMDSLIQLLYHAHSCRISYPIFPIHTNVSYCFWQVTENPISLS